MTTYVFDIDNTLCVTDHSVAYIDRVPIQPMIDKLNFLYNEGHRIVLYTARGMNSYHGHIGLIEHNVKPILVQWLNIHNVKYHELVMGKYWDHDLVYIDDRAINPIDFLNNKEIVEDTWYKNLS